MTLRSEVLIEFEKAFADEAYDGGLGALSEEQSARNVRRLAEVAAEVVQEHHFETEKRVVDALGFIDQTVYANDDNRDAVKWGNAEVLELLGEIRGFLAPESSTTDGREHV